MHTVKFIAPTIGPYQEKLQVSEGERVTLMVEASGTPQPTITWAREGREVKADYATGDGSLTLACAKPKHGGTYHFTASNKAGSVAGDVTLIVCADEEQESGLAVVDSSPLEVEMFGECVSRLHACNNAGFILQYRVSTPPVITYLRCDENFTCVHSLCRLVRMISR